MRASPTLLNLPMSGELIASALACPPAVAAFILCQFPAAGGDVTDCSRIAGVTTDATAPEALISKAGQAERAFWLLVHVLKRPGVARLFTRPQTVFNWLVGENDRAWKPVSPSTHHSPLVLLPASAAHSQPAWTVLWR